jgi:hypothetical protein
MKKFRIALLASAATVGAAGLLPAAVAVADNTGIPGVPLVGSYDFDATRSGSSDVQERRWILHNWCGDNCRNVVSSAVWSEGRATGYEGQLRLVNDRWEMTVDNERAWICDDGRHVAWTTTYSLDPATLTGTSKGSTAANCEGNSDSYDGTFTLTFVA